MDKDLEILLNRLFPNHLPSPEEWNKRYPARNLPQDAMVTRISPSPTGFVHFGGLYAGLISERFARQSGGIFMLRIEDTDKKREVAGTAELFAQALEHYGISPDEGLKSNGEEKGEYGPYRQSLRAEIYQSFAKELVAKGLAYPCFSTTEELEKLRAKQEMQGHRSGYWGDFAIWRHKKSKEALAALDQGLKPVIRLKSPGNFANKIIIDDILLGKREMPENDQDIVIIKADDLPTYHFAHAIDDHLMGTTHVIRGNEWLPSLPLHLQLFQILNWKAPAYAHLAPIQKLDGGKKRKLSKRHDKEANLEHFRACGYPPAALIEYLLNLANSNFEDWRRNNPEQDNRSFHLNWKKLANSNGPLLDRTKLDDISKEIISRFTAEKIYIEAINWAKEFDSELYSLLEENKEYSLKILDIERSQAAKPRKDLAFWSDIKKEMSYFFDSLFSPDQVLISQAEKNLNGADRSAIIQDFLNSYELSDNQEIWFEKLKITAAKHGFATDAKSYKDNPSSFRGQIGAVAQLLRILITGRTQSPNLCLVMQVMGQKRITERLKGK